MSKHIHNKRLIVISFLLVCALLASFIVYRQQTKPKFEGTGWIDCMPVLSEEQTELCKQAEAAHYPYIAY